MKNDEFVFCPLIDGRTENINCILMSDLREEAIPDKFKQKRNWKDICKKCKYHDY